MNITKPLTEQGDDVRQVWAQREYVEALDRGLGFSAQGDRWLYYDREAGRGTILYPFSGRRAVNGAEGPWRIEVPIRNPLHWLEELARY